MPACVGGEERGAFSRDELGLQRSNASRAPSRTEQILSIFGHLPLRASRWSRYDQGKEAERKRGQKNAERQLGGPSITETSREKIAKGIYRGRISVPAPSHTRMCIIYISIKYH